MSGYKIFAENQEYEQQYFKVEKSLQVKRQ